MAPYGVEVAGAGCVLSIAGRGGTAGGSDEDVVAVTGADDWVVAGELRSQGFGGDAMVNWSV